MINIKIASTADIPKIQAIANITWPLTFGPLMHKEQLDYLMEAMYSTKALKQQMKEENHHYLLIYKDNEAIAYCSYELNFRGQQQIMMHKLYILPSAQGLGLGRTMINHLCEIGRQNQQQHLRLQVLSKNEKAVTFYKHLHFSKAGNEKKILNDELGYFTDYVMLKEL